ncbi:hypothetical protein JOF29_002552 [Kribbella aluminosa]|uniref:Uncharacterized protein n=1 Tax=Kribbella aluminosa TaxID=416017 RepID=A0ABS4UIN0_9ACTN|nr:hypothetical protein [Kribbella aluminosa]MBP2351469.1 hypothetical protein [Kribbella aluminosa]
MTRSDVRNDALPQKVRRAKVPCLEADVGATQPMKGNTLDGARPELW